MINDFKNVYYFREREYSEGEGDYGVRVKKVLGVRETEAGAEN